MEPSTPHRRLRAIAGLFALGFGVLAVKLVFVHVIHPELPKVNETSKKYTSRPPHRGSLVSADGKVLAWSELRVQLQADPVVMGTNVSSLRTVAALLAATFGNATNGVTIDSLIPLLTPHAEMRHWSKISTNAFEPVTDARQRPKFDRSGRPVTRPVLTTNWFANPSFTNRAVVLFSNVPPQEWRRLESNLFHLSFPEQVALSILRTNLLRDRPSIWRRVEAKLGRNPGPVRRWDQLWASNSQARKAVAPVFEAIRRNGLLAQPVEFRSYPLGSMAAHLLGYTTNDDRHPQLSAPNPLVGATGLEHMLDPDLTGGPGQLITHAAKGHELVRRRERDVDARDGLTALLTIDTRIQAAVEDALDQAVIAIEPKAITAIVIRPATGEILALGNRPTYDPNDLHHAEVDARWNRAITAPTEPGSTFKICTYAAAIELGRVNLDETINCELGLWNPGIGKPVRDAEGHHLGLVPAREAFAHSSNVAAAKIGLRMTTNEFMSQMERLGFLHRTGVFYRQRENDLRQKVDDWGGENAGGIPAWIREGKIGTELQGRLSYGYGLYVTPLQTVFAAAALANDGVLMKPFLVRELRTPQGMVVKRFEPTIAGRAVSSETAAAMRAAMRLVMTDGSGKPARLEDFEVAGKTGTAHKQFNGQQSNDKYISTFVGFLPADHAELCILVLADEPVKRGPISHYGARACGPVFTNIAMRAAGILALKPSRTTPAPAVQPSSAMAPVTNGPSTIFVNSSTTLPARGSGIAGAIPAH